MEKEIVSSFDGLFKSESVSSFFSTNGRLTNSLNQRIFGQLHQIDANVFYGENTVELIAETDDVFVRTIETFNDSGKPVNTYLEAHVSYGDKVFVTSASAEKTSISGRNATKIVYSDYAMKKGYARSREEETDIKENGEIVFDEDTKQPILTAIAKIKSNPARSNSFVASSITLENGVVETIVNPAAPNENIPPIDMGVMSFRDELASRSDSFRYYHSEGTYEILPGVDNRIIFDSKSYLGASVLENGERVVVPSEIATEFISDPNMSLGDSQ